MISMGVRVVAVPGSLKPVSVPNVISSVGSCSNGDVVDTGFQLPPLSSYYDVYSELMQNKGLVCGNCKEGCDSGHCYKYTKLSELHQLMVEAAAVLKIEAPELYVRQSPVPNAYTLAVSGKKPFVVVHTSLVELCSLVLLHDFSAPPVKDSETEEMDSQSVSPEEQIKYLLRKKNFQEAVSLVEEFQDEGEVTNEMLSFVHAQVGFLSLFDLHFEEAGNHFLLSETMQPSEVFPFIMRDLNRWSLLVPRNRYWGLHPPPAPLENVIDGGLMAIQRAIFLKKAGVESALDNEFLLNPPSRADLLDSAINNIIRYLQASREKDLTPSVQEGVDTLLMYLYRALNRVDEMERLASSENNCIVLKKLKCKMKHIEDLEVIMENEHKQMEKVEESILEERMNVFNLAFTLSAQCFIVEETEMQNEAY